MREGLIIASQGGLLAAAGASKFRPETARTGKKRAKNE